MRLGSAKMNSSSSGRPSIAPSFHLPTLQATILSGYLPSPTGTAFIASGNHHTRRCWQRLTYSYSRDSFRVVHPLWSIVAPVAQAEVVRALIDIFRHTGWLPDCRMSLDKGFTQGGSNADSLLSDSFVKGIKAGIDWETGLQAMINDATVPGDFSVQGRGGIAARKMLGFVPVDDTIDNPPNEGPNTR
jgi:Glycosyl hydrolase family 92 catalytic domain